MRLEFLVVAIFYVTAFTCILPAPITLQLILEFAKWRAWDQIVLFENLTSLDCVISYARPLIGCLTLEGIGVSIQSAMNPNLPDALTIQKHRIGSIVLLDGLNLTSSDNILNVASQKSQYNYYVSWLMITARNTDTTIDTVLRHLNIGIDSDVVVATPASSYESIQNSTRTYWNRTCSFLRRYGEQYVFREPPLKRSDENASINLNYTVPENSTAMVYHFVHVYKIRYTDNTSLVTDFLGSWSPDCWSLRNPVSVKLRSDFKGLPIVFGVLNGTIDGQMDVTEEKANDIGPLLDFANFVTNSVNASIELVPHEKLGTLNNKVWNNLLGDVVTGAVDIGLGYITVNKERQADMSFCHPLIRYMRNIYYHPLETGTMRDIFRQPFNNYLLGCVASTYLAILIVMGSIIYAARTVLHHTEEERVGIGQVVVWCISIMCMQGSAWTPRNPSGKTVLLFSLIFALVMYNAYAGFITSILSVQASGIKSITDILSLNFKLGCSINDDEYIRTANDSHLRELYIRAFHSMESRLDTISGLKKTVQGHYGFFVSATLARRALRSTLIQERCSLKELPLPQTFTMVALPMANSCPYKKIINLTILKIRERGVLNRITERMLPEMPRCKSPTTFHSARLADVYSAFFILIAGCLSAISIGIAERIWNKRRQMKETIVGGMRRHHLIPSRFPHFTHLPHFPSFSHFSHLHLHRNAQNDFSQDHDNKRVASSSVTLENLRANDLEIDVEPVTGKPRSESRFFWRRQNNSKGENWYPFSSLHREKLGKNQRTGSTDKTPFPFHQ
ncbi:uncharacterized protein LOC108630130 isoform X2 [Ceratina calcarata]|uniref:Uncharacterized protein LOC108630130 isoform X2 n=1 Tax=Ceratina calcarata TaxID=156304 RepID=A0AAJ7JBC9_9HYME|nr:uncharacterized protein LOC108630130 isoform X2 [Ceratina calcarata]